MKKFTPAILILMLCFQFACTKKEPSAKVVDLTSRVKSAEDSLAELEEKIKKIPAGDQGLGLQMANEKELAKARLERLKYQLEVAQRADQPH